jgi:hypothetical protein
MRSPNKWAAHFFYYKYIFPIIKSIENENRDPSVSQPFTPPRTPYFGATRQRFFLQRSRRRTAHYGEYRQAILPFDLSKTRRCEPHRSG